MVLTTLDTLKFSQTLQAAGIPKEQAEAHASAFADVIKINLQELVTLDAFNNGNALLRADWRNELREALAQQRAEFQDALTQQRVDFRDALAQQRVEFRTEMRQLDGKIDVAIAKLTGELGLVKWMFGATFALMVTILVRLVFFNTP